MEIRIVPGTSIEAAFNQAAEGDILLLAAGTHRILSPILFQNKKGLTIKGEEGAVLTGSMALSGLWKEKGNGVFALEIPKGLDIQALIINGEEWIMARYPNYQPGERLGGWSADAVSPERVSRWANPAGGYVRGLHSSEWGGNSCIIEGKNPDNTLNLHWIGDNNRGSGLHKDFVMVENIREELNVPKEWFYDRETGELLAIPPAGMNLSEVSVEAAVCGELFQFQNCRDIILENLTIQNTKRMMFCSEYTKFTRSDWAIAENGAILLESCENVSIRDSRFDHVGGNCVFIRQKNRDIRVENCEFTACGASGVCVFGNQNCIRELSTWENHRTEITDWTSGPIGDDYPADILVKGCYFTDLGRFEKQSSPVTISTASRVTVQGCTMHNLPRAGVNICDGSFGGHRILDNAIFDTVKETGDHGPFNSWGRDRFWSLGGYDTGGHNGVEKRKAALLDAVETTVIAHNLIAGERGFGIDLDDGSSNYLITKNYCTGVGIKLREGFLRTVRNNFILGAPLDLHCTFAQNDDIIENNIVAAERPLSIIAQNEGYTTRMRNNLFVGAGDDTRENEMFQSYQNYICPAGDADAMAMNPREIYFEPILMEFGCPGKPLPDLSRLGEKSMLRQRMHGAVVTAVDDSIRSMGGLPDYEGVFIESFEFSCELAQMGVQKDDILIEVNGQKVKGPDEFAQIPEGFSSVGIIRAQKYITYSK